METINTDVIIVGAGPTGLSLACQLVRYGVDFVVVEKNEGVTRFSKALGVQARTLEMYEQLGLAAPAVERGMICDRVQLLANGRVRGEMHLSDMGRGMSHYPYLLFLEQSKNEELLYEYLRGHGRDVLWKSELESFSHDAEGVTARVKTEDGRTHLVSAKYLVGCDGASSRVRKTSACASRAARSSGSSTSPTRASSGTCRTTPYRSRSRAKSSRPSSR